MIALEKFERSLHLLENTTRGKSSLSCTWLGYWGSGSTSGFSYLATIGYHQELGLYSQRSHTESFSAFWPRVNWRESENSPGQIAEKFRRLLKTGPRKRTDISRNRLCSSLPAQLISFPIAHVKKTPSILNTDNDIFSCGRSLLGIRGGPFGFFGRGRLGDFETKTYCKYILVPKKSHVHDQKLDYQQVFRQGTHRTLFLGPERNVDLMWGRLSKAPDTFRDRKAIFN